MADLKISQLSSATALAGTEVVPVVQSGSTKKATIDQILAPASGKGIDFSAAGGDILKMYDEGTWTPTDGSGAGLSLSVASAIYRRVGTLVFVQIYVTYPTTANGSTAQIDGLPFTAEVGQNYSYLTGRNNTGTALVAQINANAKTMNFFNPLDVAQTNANLSGKFLILSGTYICA